MAATIDRERAGDAEEVHALHCAAFPSEAEADLVDRLRDAGRARIALVARDGDRVVGHVLFSPVTVEARGAGAIAFGLGLAPLAVLPSHQRRGIGAALVRAGLDACRSSDVGFVVVLGDPAYYQRFGFAPASARGIGNEYAADDEFMVVELRAGALPLAGGVARYAAEFAGLGAP